MAAATTIALIGAGTAIAASGAQAVAGAVRTKRAKRDIENFQRQEVQQFNTGSVNTQGEQMAMEGIGQTTAQAVDAVQAGGTRSVIGGTTAIQKAAQQGYQQIGANLANRLDAQAIRDYQEKVRGFNVTEQRQNQTIAGMGAELSAGRAAVQQGIQGIATVGGSLATSAVSGGNAFQKDPLTGKYM